MSSGKPNLDDAMQVVHRVITDGEFGCVTRRVDGRLVVRWLEANARGAIVTALAEHWGIKLSE